MCEVTFPNEEAVQLHLTDDHNAIVLVEGNTQGECIFCLLVVKRSACAKKGSYNWTCGLILICKREVAAERDSYLGDLLLHK